MADENGHSDLYRERSISQRKDIFLPSFAVSAIPGLLLAVAVTCFELEHPVANGVGICLFVLAIAAFAIGLFAKFGLGRDQIQRSLGKRETQVRDAILFIEVVVATPIELTLLIFAALPDTPFWPNGICFVIAAFGVQAVHFMLVRLLAFRWS